MNASGFGYQCSAGDTFDMIALRLYGDEKYACELLDANPTLCGQMVFTGGEILQLPVVNIPDETQGIQYTPANAPWK